MSYSIIKDYTNARGKTHQAHFSPSGKYLGPVSKRGDKPFLLVHAKPKKVNEVPENVPEVQEKSIKLFKIPEIQDKPVIIEDCDESEEETESESEEETESESEEETESESEEIKSQLKEAHEEIEQYTYGCGPCRWRGEFTKGRYRGLDGNLYEIVRLTPKCAYVCVVQKDGTLRELSQRTDSAYPTGRRLITINNSIWNNNHQILTPSCKIK